MARQVIERDKLGVLTKIGQGGQGVVYQAPNVETKFAASHSQRQVHVSHESHSSKRYYAADPNTGRCRGAQRIHDRRNSGGRRQDPDGPVAR